MHDQKTMKPANDNARNWDAVSCPIEKLYPLVELLAAQAASVEHAQRAANDNCRLEIEIEK